MFKAIVSSGAVPLLCLVFIFSVSQAVHGFQVPDAGISVLVYVDNADNEVDPRSSADFHFTIFRANQPTGFVFSGAEAGTTVPFADSRTQDVFNIRPVSTHPRYIPIFRGDCDPSGSLLIAQNTIKYCQITMVFISLTDGTDDQKVIKLTAHIDNTDPSGRTAPSPSEFRFAVESLDQSVSVEFSGSAVGVNIAYYRPRFFRIRPIANPNYPDYFATSECEVGEANFTTCRIEVSFINRQLESSPEAVVKIRPTIARTKPQSVPPTVEDFPIEVFRDGRRAAQITSTDLGVNIGGRLREGSVLEIRVSRSSRFAEYLPVVDCRGSDPALVQFVAGQKRFCDVKIYYLDRILGSNPASILTVAKHLFNSQLPGEASDPSVFSIEAYNPNPPPDGALLARVNGSSDPQMLGIDAGANVRVRELPNPTHPNYFTLYSDACNQLGARIRECIVSNYSLRLSEDRAQSILRVVTRIESVEPGGARIPTIGDFRVQVTRDGTLLDEFGGSEAGWNLAVTDASYAGLDVAPILNPAFEDYVPTISCQDLPSGDRRSRLCQVSVNYMGGGSRGRTNAAYRIVKRLVQPRGMRVTESDFSIGVFENLDPNGVPILTVPGSSTGIIAGIDVEFPTSRVREVGRPSTYVDSYSSGCSGLQARSIATCVITNTYIGAVAPTAISPEVATDEDRSVSFALGASDADSSQITFEVVQPPAFGTVTGTLPNLVYTPNPNFNGNDSLRFRVHDGQFFSQVVAVPISVRSVNDAPSSSGRSVSVITETVTSIGLTASDIDGDNLTASVVSRPANGTVTFSGLTASYTSGNDFVGSDSFSFRVSDGQAFSNTATVSVTVQNGIAVTSPSRFEANSGTTQLVFNVELLAPSLSNVSVNYATQNGTALAGTDYASKSGTVAFVRGGPLIIPVSVDVFGEQLFELNETFRVNFSSPVGAVLKNTFATGTILNDDIVVGIASMSPTELAVDALTPFAIDLTWVHPERWRLLDEIEFRIVDDEGTAMWVKFEENGTQLPFRQYNVSSRKYGDPVLPGAVVEFDTSLATMFVASSRVIGSGPTGPSATLRPRLQFKPRSRGRTFRVELFVADDFGNLQGWEHVGNITVR